MKIVVQKFGGTSLSDEKMRQHALNHILKARQNGFWPIVVVSAMGRNGAPYATDTLKNLIAIDHASNSRKNMDLLLSCGEIISAVVLSDLLEGAGEKAVALTGWQAGIITDDQFGNADILTIEKEKLMQYLDQGIIPVVTGFQGINSLQEITTLGRGGSDTTAVALAAALKADCVEIFTDVNGIMTADPRVVPEASMMEEVHYDEVFQMADQGARVIHPRAVEIARQNHVRVRIRNTSSDHPGTLICGKYNSFDTVYRTSRPDELMTAITQKDALTQALLFSKDAAPDIDSRLLRHLANSGVSIDMINFSVQQKMFVVDAGLTPTLKQILEDHPIQFQLMEHVSKVTLIGNRMTGIPGVMATIVQTLTEESIPLLQSSDSHATISCLVHTSQASQAVRALHRSFGLGRP